MSINMKDFSQFTNEEVSIKGNKGVTPEKLREIERKGSEKVAGSNIGALYNRIMKLSGEAKTYTANNEHKIEKLAEKVIRNAFEGILDDVDIELKIVDPNEVDEFMKSEDAKKEEQKNEEEEEEDKKEEDEENTEEEEEVKLSPEEIKAAVDKRKLINNIIQGEAKNTKHILHSEISKEGIKEIFGPNWKEVFDTWDEITKIADKIDWIEDPESRARMMEEHPEGMAGAVSVEFPKPKKEDEYPEDDYPEGEDDDESEESEEDREDEGVTKPTIRVRGIDYPMLLHELVKGIYELLSDPGMPSIEKLGDKKATALANVAHQNTATFLDETEDWKYGPYLAQELNDFVMENKKIDKYPNLKEFVYGYLIDSDRYTDEQFLENMKNIFSKTESARKLVDSLVDEALEFIEEGSSEIEEWEKEEKERGEETKYSKPTPPVSDEEEIPWWEVAEERPAKPEKKEEEVPEWWKQKDGVKKEEPKQPEKEEEEDYSKLRPSQIQDLIDKALDDGDYEKVKMLTGFMPKEGRSIYLKEIERINESHKFHTRREQQK